VVSGSPHSVTKRNPTPRPYHWIKQVRGGNDALAPISGDSLRDSADGEDFSVEEWGRLERKGLGPASSVWKGGKELG
jgi:hypothetical protein